MRKEPYTAFGKTVMLPVVCYYNDTLADERCWIKSDPVLWVEREEDWYALMSPELMDKFVRVIKAEDFRHEVDFGRYS